MSCLKYGALFLIVIGFAGAAETFIDTHSFGCDGLLWDYESNKWNDNKSVAWSHTLEGFDENCSITEATLTIQGRGIENVCWDFDGDGHYEKMDYVAVNFMGQDLGLLTGDTTTFDLLPYRDLIKPDNNASAEIDFQNDLFKVKGFCGGYYVDLDWQDSVYLEKSILMVTADSNCEPPLPPSTVPAPSGVVLGSIGICLVGWLRKRTHIA